MIEDVRTTLITQNTRGEPLNVRNQVIDKLRYVIKYLDKEIALPGSLSLAPCPTDPGKVLVESRLISIEEKMANIESILTSKVQSQTWA